MTYQLKEMFRVTAFSQFGKAMAYFDTPSFPEDTEIIHLLLDYPNCHAEVKKIYTIQETE